jgi:CheY-like chemotaxis protein
LSVLGVDVLVTYSGQEALDAVPVYKPSVLLLDIGMPGMDGYEVAREIRKRFDADGITLIALTGWGQDEDRRRSRAAGFDYHLIKPADLSALEALLASLDNHGRPTSRPESSTSVPLRAG